MTTSSHTQQESDQAPSAVEINTLLADLRVAKNAVDNKEWMSSDLAGDPPVSIEVLGASDRPLSVLDSSGMGFLTPMVSFLEEPLGQLRGDPSSVSSGAGEFNEAGQNGTAVAEEYRATAGEQTSEWSGQAATDYLSKGIELADGILSIAETSLTSAKALMGAGEVVAQVAGTVTQLITEATGKIVPIMSEAIAAAPATFGQSIAAAIPQCVQIATDYAGRIAGKMGELLSSGENLMKLVEGALGIVKIVKQGLSFIGEQAQGGTSDGSSSESSSQSSQSSQSSESSESSESSQSTSDGDALA